MHSDRPVISTIHQPYLESTIKLSRRSNADVALYDSWKLLYDCLTVTLSSSIHLRVLRSIYTKRYILDQG
ncbi:hypothetical protein DERP_002235 [Dermatophagoides pteronyssinus]|uniref:Uncharacterized protein n=1 Tax=Dermatophagoides pteronyssinus TaxID=6956 RepID=A0ABQ8JHT5_DERPT|nr:hypothetical protein DERP_002235 [Dermatophagoides pteronyssinus]